MTAERTYRRFGTWPRAGRPTVRARGAGLGFAPSEGVKSVRSSLTIASTSEVDVMLVDAADESSRLLEQAESTNVGEMTLEQIHADVRNVVRD
jgi:hypothetical protein